MVGGFENKRHLTFLQCLMKFCKKAPVEVEKK